MISHLVTWLNVLPIILTLTSAQTPTPAPPPPPAHPQLNTWNATPGLQFHVGDVHLSDGIDFATAEAAMVAANFERSNWAGDSVNDDPFYSLADINVTALNEPGQVLKIQQSVNVSLFTLPPELALSRIVFTTETFNGSVVPASAYVLWPYSPRPFNNVSGYPVVGWAHGTTGIFDECAPSHLRNLWYQYHAPFPLALQGYVVVAPDYAGLGINSTSNGTYIPHQWSANPAGANDLFNAVKAAQQAWTELSKEFVLMGHSEGGGFAWSAAQRQAIRPVPGYLGAIAASPLTSLLPFAKEPVTTLGLALPIALVANALTGIFPDSFQLSDWLTPQGISSFNLYKSLQGCQAVAEEVWFRPGMNYIQPNWSQSWVLPTYENLTSNGGDKPFKGPLLVLQGTADVVVDHTITDDIVNRTCAAQPEALIQYNVYEGVDHVPTMYAAQRDWLDWIANRFNGFDAPSACPKNYTTPIRPVEQYEKSLNYFMEWPEYAYEVA